jgi:hypothetical protein
MEKAEAAIQYHWYAASANAGAACHVGTGMRWAIASVLHTLRGEVPDNAYNQDIMPRWQSRFAGKSVWDVTG